MKKLLIAALAFGLAGCSTVSDLRQQSPTISGDSHKTALGFSGCVATKWSDLHYSVTTIPKENGITLQVPDHIGGALALLDVDTSGSGSNFKYYETSRTYAAVSEVMKSCK